MANCFCQKEGLLLSHQIFKMQSGIFQISELRPITCCLPAGIGRWIWRQSQLEARSFLGLQPQAPSSTLAALVSPCRILFLFCAYYGPMNSHRQYRHAVAIALGCLSQNLSQLDAFSWSTSGASHLKLAQTGDASTERDLGNPIRCIGLTALLLAQESLYHQQTSN